MWENWFFSELQDTFSTLGLSAQQYLNTQLPQWRQLWVGCLSTAISLLPFTQHSVHEQTQLTPFSTHSTRAKKIFNLYIRIWVNRVNWDLRVNVDIFLMRLIMPPQEHVSVIPTRLIFNWEAEIWELRLLWSSAAYWQIRTPLCLRVLCSDCPSSA